MHSRLHERTVEGMDGRFSGRHRLFITSRQCAANRGGMGKTLQAPGSRHHRIFRQRPRSAVEILQMLNPAHTCPTAGAG